MYKPIRKNVFIKAYEWPLKSKGGVWLPQSVQYSPTKGGYDPWRGRVIAVGPEVTQLKIGEIVRYQPNNYKHFTVEDEGARYIFLDENLIYAVEDGEEVLIRALKDKVVFLPDKAKDMEGSIYLPENRKVSLLYGTIVIAGEDSGVKIGDKVVMRNHSTWQYYDSAGVKYIMTSKVNLLVKVNR